MPTFLWQEEVSSLVSQNWGKPVSAEIHAVSEFQGMCSKWKSSFSSHITRVWHKAWIIRESALQGTREQVGKRCKRYWNWTWPGHWTLLSCSFLMVIPELLLKGKNSSLYCSSNQQERDQLLSQHELSLPTSVASPSPHWKREKRKNSLLKKTNPKLCNCCFSPTGGAFV